ncbi:MAG: cytochrome c [Gammaproteobacteria bacterium]|nr:cytochrome c [Gammaproteobacteria bacterium]
MKRIVRIGLAAACSLVVASAIAQNAPPTPEQQAQTAVDQRQAAFKLLAWNMGPLGGMARNRVPFDAAVVKVRAERIAQLAAMIDDLYGPDTTAFADLKTESLPGIWKSKDAFHGKAMDLANAATALATVAATGDQGETVKAIGGVGKACGSCHDDYRAEH